MYATLRNYFAGQLLAGNPKLLEPSHSLAARSPVASRIRMKSRLDG